MPSDEPTQPFAEDVLRAEEIGIPVHHWRDVDGRSTRVATISHTGP